jgi:transcription elongation factor GreA
MIKKDNKILFTKEGLVAIQEEYEDLTKNQRPTVLEELQSARALGDVSENGMYSAAREKQSFIEGRIREIEDILKRAEVAKDVSSTPSGMVAVGRTIVLETQKDKITYSLVGAEEVNFAENKISHESPLGQALIGKKVGDIVEVKAPAGVVKYKVIEVK